MSFVRNRTTSRYRAVRWREVRVPDAGTRSGADRLFRFSSGWLAGAACTFLISACNPFGDDIPRDLPAQAKGNWGPDGKTCPRLDGVYRYAGQDGSGFAAADEIFPPTELGQWSVVKLASRSASEIALARAMSREQFIEAALGLRKSAPARYERWRSEVLLGPDPRDIRVPGETQERPVLVRSQEHRIMAVSCEAGWATLYRGSRLVKKGGEPASSVFTQVDVTPDVDKGLLVRTARCPMKTTDILSVQYCSSPATTYSRLAPSAWPADWVPTSNDLPPPAVAETAPALQAATAQNPAAHAGSAADENHGPTDDAARLATHLFERLDGRLPQGVTLDSISARGTGVVLVLHGSPTLDMPALKGTLGADPAVGSVSVSHVSVVDAQTSEYRLLLLPRRF